MSSEDARHILELISRLDITDLIIAKYNQKK